MIKPTTIIIHRAEGLHHECKTVTLTGDNLWEQADSALAYMRRTAPEAGQGYHKTDFKVVYENNEEYAGRIDLQLNVSETVAQHMRRFLLAASGREKPYHMDEEKWQKMKAIPRIAALMPDACEWLDKYEIGPD